MSLMSEFKAFAMRGNVVDLAVGVVIGAAFGKIVTAMVDGLIMPGIGIVTGGGQSLTAALNAEPFKLGTFVQTIIDFTIVAFVIFLVVKAMNTLMRKEDAKPPEPSPEQKLLMEIRDLLAKRPV
jgi:large conductance mechanosensitive channel